MHLLEVFFHILVGRLDITGVFRPDFQYPVEAHQGYCAKRAMLLWDVAQTHFLTGMMKNVFTEKQA